MNLSTIAAESLAALVARLQETTARINTIWGKEHQADGTHVLPKFHTQTSTEVGASNFRGLAGTAMTWTGVSITSFDWWKHGDAMFVNAQLSGTVGGVVNTALSFDIPNGFRAKSSALHPVFVIDAGARTTGYFFVSANGTTIDVYRTDGANFTAGTVAIYGQIQFRTTT